MIKKIALAVVLVVSAVTVGASIARAKAPHVQVTPQTPNGFCVPPGTHC